MTLVALTGAKIFDGEQFLTDHAVLVDKCLIVDVLPTSKVPTSAPRFDLRGGVLAPGFIDLQVNGGGGALFNNTPTPEALAKIVKAHCRYGTTSILPTVISDTRTVCREAVAAVVHAQHALPGILGIHLEGPFFSEEKRGAHRAAYIREPQTEDIDWLCQLEALRVVLTLAPERVSTEQIKALAEAGIFMCVGHSKASYEQVTSAIHNGLRGATHLFNAMSQISAREPGVVGAVLDHEECYAGIIADGYHVSDANIRLAYRAKTLGKLFLVSDAMATVGSPLAHFTLYDEVIEEKHGRLINRENLLAGSAITLIDAIKYCVTEVGLPLEHCLNMASLYPAKFIKVDDYLGQIKKNYRADLVHFDQNFAVTTTWVAGQTQNHNEPILRKGGAE